jgi:hypothetical protein
VLLYMIPHLLYISSFAIPCLGFMVDFSLDWAGALHPKLSAITISLMFIALFHTGEKVRYILA